ncbi:MAG: hypothetical protein K0R00_936 [Herbinix sp.]|nr:hypothetical protein [Herbinix sp.]
MRSFDLLRSITDIKKYSSVIFDVFKDAESAEMIEEILNTEIEEEGLQTIESIAQSGYPLSLEGKQ